MAQQPSPPKTETKSTKAEPNAATRPDSKLLKTESVAPTAKAFTVGDIAKDAGIKPTVARRLLRAAGIKRPKDGWSWTDKAAAKDAIEAVQRGLRPKSAPTHATPPPKAPTGPLGRA